MHDIARKKANWYTTTHKNDQGLTVEDIHDMFESGDVEELAQRVSKSASKIPGTRPFWTAARNDLMAQIKSPECGTPHVFFTASSADVQWPDMHQHMPSWEEGQPEGPQSYHVRLKDLNNNPAIAGYYFQKWWEIFFHMFIKPKFGVKDWWWQYEWQHHGSSHVHGFFWMENAPSVEDLDTSNQVQLQSFIDFWDQHVSTWHPNLSCPPASIHPSAMLFNTLEDTKKELAECLNRFQRHTQCTPGYCQRRNKTTGEVYCRFGFPHQQRDKSEFVPELGRDFPELHFKRNDPLLNSFNTAFILGWRANIDI